VFVAYNTKRKKRGLERGAELERVRERERERESKHAVLDMH
jgi:hypothetical protein